WWHDRGSVHVFARNWSGWTHQAQLTSTDAQGRYFGHPIALSGEVALVGEFYPPVGAHMWPGRLHVFVRSESGWSLQGQLTASDLGARGHFGSSVAMAGETVLVGACYAENWPQAPVGAAYVFRLEKALPTILQLPSASPIPYGQSLASSELTGGEADVPGTFAFMDPAIVPQAGLASFEVTFTPVDTAGYRNAVALVPVMVKRAPLTIRADDQEKVVGSENPPLTASYVGFVPGDSPEVLDVPVTLSTTAKANSPVGSYPITARGAADANYVITHQDGVLTVVEPGIFFCTEAGSGELRSLDMDPDRPGAQYRLIFNSVPQSPGTYRLPSSAPGNLAGAVHYSAPPRTVVTSRLSVPMPLQLAGARPVRVFGDFRARDLGGGEWSIRLGPEITGAFSIHLTSTPEGTTVEVSGSMPASGVIGIVLQLENAWKKTVGWTFDARLNAAGTPGTSSAGGRLPQFQACVLSARWGTQTQPEVRYRATIESENRLNR
ncbi:MAG: MBG domain-containing protein, partial [Verrucomicrobiota bacterium]